MKTILLAITLCFIFVQSASSQWQLIYNQHYIYSIGTQGSNIFTGTGYGLFVSTNNGSDWTLTSLNSNINVYSLASLGNYIFGATSSGVYSSSNSGVNWSQTSLNNRLVRSVISSGNNIFACTDTAGVYLSTNNGLDWVQTSLNNHTVYWMAANGNNVYAGTNGNGVYASTNNGTNWIQTSLNNRRVVTLAVSGNYIYAGTYAYGVYISSDNGLNWVQALTGHNIRSLSADGNSVFSASDSGIYVSNNNGISWEQKNEGLGGYHSMGCQCIFNGSIFAAKDESNGVGIFRRPLAELVGIHQISTETPDHFSLSQNYPNPFNPVTNIEFTAPKSAFVKLSVYDITGKEIETLVNENLTAGTYKADWNASSYSSGIYFYTISSDSYHETRKMILVK